MARSKTSIKPVWDRKILQIIPASPGWRMGLKDDDGSVFYSPIVCWALVEETETLRGRVLQTNTSVEALIPGNFGDLDLADDYSNPMTVVPPGHSAVVDGESMFAELNSKVN